MDNLYKKEKKGISTMQFLLIIIVVLLGFYTYTSTVKHKEKVLNLIDNCSPVNSEEEIKLDVDSTLVRSLYKKVETNIREDMAQPEFNDNMKLYLAYRQILEKDKYESNCNLFTNVTMEPFTCVEKDDDKPLAFKEKALILEWKKLYGEINDKDIPLGNIQLGSSCIGGYAYIAQRGEFVEGKCSSQNAISFSVDKELKEATSTGSKIVLKEEVKYRGSENYDVPASLKSGYYYYTFRLDTNYNYVLISKTHEYKQ